MALTNRRWLLVHRPQGELSLDDFAYDEQAYALPELEPGQVLVKTEMFSCAPTMRNFMNDPGKSYRASVALKTPVIGVAGGVVVRSRHPDFPEGSRLTGIMTWQDYTLLSPDASPTPILHLPDDADFEQAMGVLGLNALTGYFGMLRVGEPKPGETVVVSSAAGSTGSVAAQVARIKGCRVIGIAGGKAKCDWLVEQARLDHAIDYKHENVRERLAELCPNGVDVFFDNVGGDILQAVMANVAIGARIAVCGQISAYDDDKPAPGPEDMMKVVYWQVRIQGFVMGQFAQDEAVGRADLLKWYQSGELCYRTDVRQGFKSLPATFIDLFKGGNEGALLVRS
jgi:NADPH-dependent curcumin reductase CurA